MDLPFNGIGGAKKPRSGSRPSSPDNSEEVPTCFACFSKKEETGKNVVSIKQYLVIYPGGGAYFISFRWGGTHHPSGLKTPVSWGGSASIVPPIPCKYASSGIKQKLLFFNLILANFRT